MALASSPVRMKLGGPQRVLLLAHPQALLAHMTEVVGSIEGLQLAGAFDNAEALVDWTVWDRSGWHVAFVDLTLPGDASRDVIRRLFAQPRPGTVVALSAHLWKEIREDCARMGVYQLIEKGDLVAFRGVLEERMR
ncbi:response regulator transcription factor [Ramlibacter sp. G-1-2-2]|uniref:Response regulator transcription factor n=1 Tax=Ramlibacter agri TaxID=2728837 RepID=A0A848HH13_9BURK|nr:response regulator transcription factor [Ramlibacter agri]NML46958.1 response regulator transcription factor [Ramlibacter agri]